MKKHWRALLVTMAMTAAPALAQDAMTPAEEATASAEAAAALQNYMKVFSAQDAKAVADKVWAPVGLNVAESGVSIVEPTSQATRVAGTIKQLVASGWGRTDTPSTTVCLQSRNVAFVSGDYRRLRKDGSVMEQRGSVSIFAKLPDGWKMVARFVTAPGKVVTCDGSAAKASSAPEIAKIKAEVNAAGTNYMTQFSARNPKGMAQDVYSHPAIQISPKDVSVIDPAAQQAGLEAVTKRFIATGWNKTEWTQGTQVCVLSPTVAMMSGPFARFDVSNKQISNGGETQVFAKTPQGWKLILLLTIDPKKTAVCND